MATDTVKRLTAAPQPFLATPGRILELDGLRGIAISLVFIFHCITLRIIEPWPNPLFFVRYATGFSWTGVDLFFVLSGFLIGGILLSVRESPNYFRVFYFRRACRILPAYLAYLLFILVCYGYIFAVYRPQLAVTIKPMMPWFSYLAFIQNFWMAARNTLGPDVIGHTWSLAVEEQFYLTLPAVIWIVSPRRLPRILLGGIFIAPLLRFALLLVWKSRALNAVYVLLPCRMDSLLIGVVLALLLRRPHNAIGLNGAYPTASFGYTWIAVFYATIMVLALTQPLSFLAGFLRNHWLRSLGRIAYGTYLIHMFVFKAVMLVMRGHDTISWPADLAASLFSIALSITIAQISWIVFEKRFVVWGSTLKYQMQSRFQPDLRAVV